MHLNHKPSEIMQVDWAGDAASVTDTNTGEIIPAYGIFQFDFAANQFQIVSIKRKICAFTITAQMLPFVFSSRRGQTAFLQFGYHREKKIAGVQRNAIPLALGFQ